MSGQIPRPMGPIALFATLLVWSVSVGVPTTTARADDCLAEPNSSAPAGSHWYYHLDKTTQRKCWYIRATDQPAQAAAAEATSDGASVSPAPPISAEEPAAASADIPMSISPGDGAPPLPRVKVPAVKPRPASVSSATSPQSVQQSAPKATPQGSSASSVREPPAAKAPLSSQISDQAVPARAPAATPAWPDPPVAVAIAPEPTAAPSDARTEIPQTYSGHFGIRRCEKHCQGRCIDHKHLRNDDLCVDDARRNVCYHRAWIGGGRYPVTRRDENFRDENFRCASPADHHRSPRCRPDRRSTQARIARGSNRSSTGCTQRVLTAFTYAGRNQFQPSSPIPDR